MCSIHTEGMNQTSFLWNTCQGSLLISLINEPLLRAPVKSFLKILKIKVINLKDVSKAGSPSHNFLNSCLLVKKGPDASFPENITHLKCAILQLIGNHMFPWRRYPLSQFPYPCGLVTSKSLISAGGSRGEFLRARLCGSPCRHWERVFTALPSPTFWIPRELKMSLIKGALSEREVGPRGRNGRHLALGPAGPRPPLQERQPHCVLGRLRRRLSTRELGPAQLCRVCLSLCFVGIARISPLLLFIYLNCFSSKFLAFCLILFLVFFKWALTPVVF